jgi:hypothetical protein
LDGDAAWKLAVDSDAGGLLAGVSADAADVLDCGPEPFWATGKDAEGLSVAVPVRVFLASFGMGRTRAVWLCADPRRSGQFFISVRVGDSVAWSQQGDAGLRRLLSGSGLNGSKRPESA